MDGTYSTTRLENFSLYVRSFPRIAAVYVDIHDFLWVDRFKSQISSLIVAQITIELFLSEELLTRC